MRAIEVDSEKKLHWREVSDPALRAEEVLIHVHAAGVNRADLLQVMGLYPPPKGASQILGLEVAGEVIEVGSKVHGVEKGDRVSALLAGGGYAERVAVDYRLLFEVPDFMSFETATAIPEVWITAYLNLCLEANLKAGERVLIHAGASGVGTAAIQIALFLGAEVFTTSGGERKSAFCKSLGAHYSINYKSKNFFDEIHTITGGEGVDVILDAIGGAYFPHHLKLLRHGGRLVQIALMNGVEATIDLRLLLAKKLRLIGSTLRNRSINEKAQIIEKFKSEIYPELVNQSLKPVIDSVFSVLDVSKAHERMKNNENIGKIILKI